MSEKISIDNLSDDEKKVYNYLQSLPKNEFSEVSSAPFSFDNISLDEILVSLEEKGLIELTNKSAFVDERDLIDEATPKAKVI